MEYAKILLPNLPTKLLKKLVHIETSAIKIAFHLPPWTMNAWCYHYYSSEPILDRLKRLAMEFLSKHSTDKLIQELVLKPSSFVKAAQAWAN
jgi:hypothetical protein